jgi:CRISPR/Cas system endoribonuclease Cas6 (RAMP superfamily)
LAQERSSGKKIWLPSIELETNLSIKRIEFIKICGNISKHNFSRLSGVVCELIEIFKRNNINLKDEDALLILGEFYEWFHTSIFNYHSSAIAEFLNNIRWGIHDYLKPEFHQSIVYENNEHPRRYRFTYPNEVKNNFAKACYWDLMNEVRSSPYIEKFQVTRFLKMRY